MCSIWVMYNTKEEIDVERLERSLTNMPFGQGGM